MSSYVGMVKAPEAKDWRVVVRDSQDLDSTVRKTLTLAQVKETQARVIRVHNDKWDIFDEVFKK